MKIKFSKLSLIASLALTFIISHIVSADSSLYPDDIFFQHVFEGEEIVLGETRAIYQDAEGFMWLSGWDRLVKYDGSKFREVFLRLEKDGKTQDISAPYTTSIFEDSQGKLWFGSASGLRWYDKVNNVLKRYQYLSGSMEGLSTSWIDSAVEHKPGEFIVSLEDSVVILDVESGDFSIFTGEIEKPNDPSIPGATVVNDIFIDSKNRIWMGTNRGLDLFDYQTKTFEHPFFDPENPPKTEATEAAVKSIVEDENGKLWLATGSGIVVFDPITKQTIKNYQHDPDDENTLGSNDIWQLLHDSKGRIWATGDHCGLNLYNPASDNFINYTNTTGKKGALATVSTRTAFEDANGDIWVGLFPDGVDFFDQSSTAITTMRKGVEGRGLSFDSVYGLVEEESGNLWLGTDGRGLNYFNRETKTVEVFRHDTDDENSLASDAILSLMLDSKNTLWMGHWGGGITKMDLNTKQFTRVPSDLKSLAVKRADYLTSEHIWSIIEDSKGDVWIGTHTGGVNKYDRKTGDFHHYIDDIENPNAIPSEWIWKTFESSQGKMWFGSNTGFIAMDREKETFRQIDIYKGEEKEEVNKAVYDIYEDELQRLWLGTTKGLYLFDPIDEKVIRKFGTDDGLYDEAIRTIAGSVEGGLWLGTSNGVSVINMETFEITNYHRNNGELVGSMNYNAGIITSAKEVVVGGVNGLKFYKPDELQPNLRVPPVVFTELTLFFETVHPNDKTGLLTSGINETEKIVLNYKQSSLGIEFAALNYRDPDKNEYAFILEGFDNKWNYVGNSKTAKYTNLDPGTYTFKVKASNNDGIWNEEGRSLTIVQLPPPWQTWWAYTLYFIFVFGAVALLFYRQILKRQNIEKQNRLLEETVANRTVELSRKNNDIQAMLSNMPQGLFTIDSDLKIHHEYSVYLEEIFETKKIAGRLYSELLFSGASLNRDYSNQMYETARVVIGEDELNYEFNHHLFVSEYEIEVNDRKKFLSLEWNPIVDGNVVSRLMVSVRDVTLLKQAESESVLRKRELDIICQLLEVSTKKFVSYEKSTLRLLEECKETIVKYDKAESSAIALLFRNIHTIKGNSRTYGFTYLSEVAHDVEEVYMNARSDPKFEWDHTVLLDGIRRIEEAEREYSEVFRSVLSRGETNDTVSNNESYTLNQTLAENMQKCLCFIESHFGDTLIEREFKPIRSAIDNVNTTRFEEIVHDYLKPLPEMAEQLGKVGPKVDVQGMDCRVDNCYVELIQNIIPHLLRNSIDHGIEAPEKRELVGKMPAGNILVKADKSKNGLKISFSDDGQGLNLAKLKELGVKAGKWLQHETPSDSEIADQIFHSGTSTAETVSDISGRGVGMDAVKQYVENNGGAVEIVLLEIDDTSIDAKSDFVSMRIEVSLPPVTDHQKHQEGINTDSKRSSA